MASHQDEPTTEEVIPMTQPPRRSQRPRRPRRLSLDSDDSQPLPIRQPLRLNTPIDSDSLPLDSLLEGDSIPLPPSTQQSTIEVEPFASTPISISSSESPSSSEDEDSPEPLPRSRKRAAPVRKTPAPKRQARKPKKTSWRSEGVLPRFVEFLLEAKTAGLFASSKKKTYKSAYKSIAERCREAWPQGTWGETKIKNRYNYERWRYRVWVQFCKLSGVTYDHELNLPTADEEVWTSFIQRNSTSSRPVGWLREQPLGVVAHYKAVFEREVASCGNIGEPDELLAAEASDGGGGSPPWLTDDDEDEDDSVDEDEEDEEDEEAPAPKRVSQGRKRVGQRAPTATEHRRDTDPDLEPERAERVRFPAYVDEAPVVARERVVKEKKESEATIFGRSLTEAATISASPQVAGAADLTKAVTNLRTLFPDLDPPELMACLGRLQESPTTVALWHGLDLETKCLYVRAWKRVVP